MRIALAVAAVIALGCTGLAAAAPASPSAAATAGSYTAVISPGYTTAGQPTTFTVTFKNTSSANAPLRSAELVPPKGFALQKALAARGRATIRHNVLVLRGTAIRQGASEKLQVTAIAPLGGCTNPNATTPNGNGAPVRWRSAGFMGAAATGPGLKLQATGSSLATTETCAMQAPCGDGGPACSTSVNTNVSSYTAVSNAGSGTLIGGLDVGRHLKCAGYRPRDPNWYESILSGGPAAVNFQVQYTLKGSTPDGAQVCLGLPYDFETASGGNAPSGTLPNGKPGFIGLLPACGPAITGPCLVSITSTRDPNSKTGSDVNEIVQIPPPPAGIPAGDPWYGP